MDSLIRRAVAAYYRTGGGSSEVSPERSRVETDGEMKHVVVCDADGSPVMVYRVDKVPSGGEQLRSLRTIPEKFRKVR